MSERDIEKEHLAQLRRWKETRGELHCKSPPRMHGARAIMTAEPPSRQDLRQNPTIIVESPVATATTATGNEGGRGSSAEDEKGKKSKRKKKTGKEEEEKEQEQKQEQAQTADAVPPPPPPAEGPSPFPALAEPEDIPSVLGSLQSLSSVEHDTYL